MMTETSSLNIPGVGAPLRKALQQKGITRLDQLDGANYGEILALHGVGAKGLNRVLGALRKTGGDMEQAPTEAEIARQATSFTLTAGHTGRTSADIKTRPTSLDPQEFCQAVEWPTRRADGLALLDMFNQITGVRPVMWGPTMVGYGQVHYASTSGRHGDWFKIGFSPRKASLTLYGMQGAPNFQHHLASLGKHKLGAGCLYITNLKSTHLHTLRALIQDAWEAPLTGHPQ